MAPRSVARCNVCGRAVACEAPDMLRSTRDGRPRCCAQVMTVCTETVQPGLPAPVAGQQALEPDPIAEQRAMRVLLVDDGQGAVEALAEPVRAMGYEVRVADRNASIASVRAGFPDVLVLDLDPSAVEAIVFLRTLCEQAGRRKPLVVALTEAVDPNAEYQTGENGLHVVLVKPIDSAVFAGLFRRFRELLVGVGTLDSGGEPAASRFS